MIASDTNPILDLALKNGPLVALLLIILWGGFKKNPWWVFGWVYRDLAVRHNRLRQQFDDLAGITRRTTQLVKEIVNTEAQD